MSRTWLNRFMRAVMTIDQVRRSGNRGVTAIRRCNCDCVGADRSGPSGATAATHHRSEHAEQ